MESDKFLKINMGYSVCKFGGTSLATRDRIEKVLDIIMQDPARKFVVVSAPGKRNPEDMGITNLLIRAIEESENGCVDYMPASERVIERFKEIGHDFPDLTNELEEELHKRSLLYNPLNYKDCIKAFGEHASARIVTEIARQRGLEARFIDPKEIGLRVTNHNSVPQPDSSCYAEIGRRLLDCNEIPLTFIPGFYGYTKEGLLVTLPRGGSDTTGAVIANAVDANVYENWTDEDGLRRADPRVVENPELILELTYMEARELASKGFKLQEDSLVPLIGKHIPLNVRNTNNPLFQGSWIVQDRLVSPNEYMAGVACKPGYVAINLEKVGMNSEIGFGRKVLQILEENRINYEHMPTGNDNMSIIIERCELEGIGRINSLFREINRIAGHLEIMLREKSLALVAIAGLGIRQHPEVPARALYALSKQGIYPRTINMGASNISFFIGIDEDKGDDAVNVIYKEFFS